MSDRIEPVRQFDAIAGLKIKRKEGDLITIRHRSGDEITLQVIQIFSTKQVLLAFEPKRETFAVFRSELLK